MKLTVHGKKTLFTACGIALIAGVAGSMFGVALAAIAISLDSFYWEE